MTASHSDALVLFGMTGDLAHKMTFPALYAMDRGSSGPKEAEEIIAADGGCHNRSPKG
jgi:glucose-6-phosphate 1-dehydrogenase